jgi:hypothetical protein
MGQEAQITLRNSREAAELWAECRVLSPDSRLAVGWERFRVPVGPDLSVTGAVASATVSRGETVALRVCRYWNPGDDSTRVSLLAYHNGALREPWVDRAGAVEGCLLEIEVFAKPSLEVRWVHHFEVKPDGIHHVGPAAGKDLQ